MIADYHGFRTDGIAKVVVNRGDGRMLPLRMRLDLANKSPTGFEWGYHGSGPAQLALALLADALGDDARALKLMQHFKRAKIGHLDADQWRMSAESIREWAAGHEREHGDE